MRNTITSIIGSAVLAFAVASPFAAQAESQAETRSGTFTGASDHITTGGVHVIKTANGGAVVILDSDFTLDGAPDPRVGFGKDGVYEDVADLGFLQNLAGVQVYIVPPYVNVDDYNEVYIWCKKFTVPLGIAAL